MMPDALSPTQPIIVRPENVAFAVQSDEDEIYSFLVRLWSHNEMGWGLFYDPAIVLKQIEAGTRPDPLTRTDPTDERRGIIGIIRQDGAIVASVGLFIMPPVWFTTLPGLTELWMHVRPGHAGLSKDLFAFSLWAHAHMKADLTGWNAPFPLSTGFMHRGENIEKMERLWRRRSGGKKAGVLFMVD